MTGRRVDIQALRGVAVLLVVLYHAGLPVSAGYLGVDIFFVISGFLITGLIKNGLERGDFSFREFYYRRAKRLLPAANVVILACILAAPFVLTAVEIENLQQQILGAVTFTANIVLWLQTGYFDAAAETKPLLHFWSLAIEEQYYLLMPLFLFLAPRRAWFKTLAFIFVTSASLSFYWAAHNPSAAFYLLPTRAWELAMGSLGALLPASVFGYGLLSAARLVAIPVIILVPIFPTGLPHPGLDAMTVCAATLVIIIGRDGNPFERSMPARMLAFVGDFSYSLYLVHWPLIVFVRATWLGEAPAQAMLAAVALSIVLAWLLYELVEEPFRRGFQAFPRRTIGGIATISALLVVSPSALSAGNTQVDFSQARRPNYGIDRSCAFGEKFPFTGTVPDNCRTKPGAKVLVWGDSYAMVWTTALIEPLADLGVEQATMSGCDPLIGMARFSKKEAQRYNRDFAQSCTRFNDQVLSYIASNPELDIVVVGGRFQNTINRNNRLLVRGEQGQIDEDPSIELAAQGLSALASKVRAAGKRIVIMAPPPSNGTDIAACLERRARGLVTFGEQAKCEISVESHLEARGETLKMLMLASRSADAPVIDVFDFLCDQTKCRTEIAGTFLYRDYGHLTNEGARLIGKQARLREHILAAAR